MRPAIAIIVGYLLGSIPFGYLIVRASKGADVRETGSGGTGATNVSRRAGKLAGIVTLLLDALKGAAAIAFAQLVLGLFGPTGAQLQIQSFPSARWWVAAAGVAAIVGHMFPIWLRFRGGKGVATGVGIFLVLAPMAIALAGVIFLMVVIATRFVSLGSMLAAISIPLLIWGQHLYVRPNPEFMPTLAAAIVIALLIIFAHHANIKRLVGGTESRFR